MHRFRERHFERRYLGVWAHHATSRLRWPGPNLCLLFFLLKNRKRGLALSPSFKILPSFKVLLKVLAHISDKLSLTAKTTLINLT